MRPKATFLWNEQRPSRSQARRVHPGQAQARVPAIACTRSTCLVQMLPCWAGEPQEWLQLAAHTHPLGMGMGMAITTPRD